LETEDVTARANFELKEDDKTPTPRVEYSNELSNVLLEISRLQSPNRCVLLEFNFHTSHVLELCYRGREGITVKLV
jgi:hypothetical protein